jgi:hypothetical protein
MTKVDTGVTGGTPNLLGSFTAAARPLPENTDWQAFGTSHVPENCGDAWVWQPCASEVVAEKPLNPGVDAVAFKPFMVEFNAASCDGIPADHADLEARARRGLAVRVGHAIDRALSSSLPDGSPNESPNLPESADDETPVAGPGGIICTIGGLIQEAYDCGATGELFIHVPAWTLAAFLKLNALTQVGTVYKFGPHTVIFDAGYSNEGPTGSPAAGPGEAWMYVTGPFEYATGPIKILDDTTGGVSPRLNRANIIAAQLAIYRFDPCCVKAARITVC